MKIYEKLGLNCNDKLIIAGPCSVESEEQILQTAKEVAMYDVHVLRGGIWKPRTRPDSFEGVGAAGLKWVKKAGNAVNLPVATEVAMPAHVEKCMEHKIDIMWIGARTTVNPFAVQAIADALRGTDIPVLVKNPINPDLSLWLGAIERLDKAGIKKIAALHRGFSSYYKKEYRYEPQWKIPIEIHRIAPSIPLLCDPSHICGNRKLILSVSQKAMDLLFDGLMIETHIDPDIALSDAKQQLRPGQLGALLHNLKFKTASVEEIEFQIGRMREEIDEIDYQIIAMLAKRTEISKRIGKEKRESNISLFQPERWNHIVKSRKESGKKYNLSDKLIMNIFQEIHEDSIRQQNGSDITDDEL